MFKIIVGEWKKARYLSSQGGNGKIHHYPLERLLIFTEKLFKSLKKELAEFKTKQQKVKIVKTKQTPNVKYKPLPQRIIRDYEPSKISHAYDGDYWRWQRVSEWFKEYAQDYE